MNLRLLTVTVAVVMSYSPPPWRPDIITPYPQAPGVVAVQAEVPVVDQDVDVV